jgi:hypothetical protein
MSCRINKNTNSKRKEKYATEELANKKLVVETNSFLMENCV